MFLPTSLRCGARRVGESRLRSGNRGACFEDRSRLANLLPLASGPVAFRAQRCADSTGSPAPRQQQRDGTASRVRQSGPSERSAEGLRLMRAIGSQTGTVFTRVSGASLSRGAPGVFTFTYVDHISRWTVGADGHDSQEQGAGNSDIRTYARCVQLRRAQGGTRYCGRGRHCHPTDEQCAEDVPLPEFHVDVQFDRQWSAARITAGGLSSVSH